MNAERGDGKGRGWDETGREGGRKMGKKGIGEEVREGNRRESMGWDWEGEHKWRAACKNERVVCSVSNVRMIDRPMYRRISYWSTLFIRHAADAWSSSTHTLRRSRLNLCMRHCTYLRQISHQLCDGAQMAIFMVALCNNKL